MSLINRRSVVVGFVFGLILSASVGQAEPFDITYCGSGTMTMVSESKELTQFVYEFKSAIQSNHYNKLFHNFNIHLVGVRMIASGMRDETGYFRLIDRDGDFIAGEVTGVGTEDEDWKFLQGIGKWKGITGRGRSGTFSGGKPTTTATFEMCNRAIGTFELPK